MIQVLLSLFSYHFHLLKYLSHPLTFSISVSFALKWVSYWQHTSGYWMFYPFCHAIYFFIRGFNPLYCKVIIDRCVFIIIFKSCFRGYFVFFLCSFLFFPLCFDDCLLYYAWVFLFLVFVNLLCIFYFWLPCFSGMLIHFYIYLLQTGSHIGINIFLK